LRALRTGLLYFVLILVTIIMLFPFYWMIITSVKTDQEVLKYPPTFYPTKIVLTHYNQIALAASFPRYLLNSIIVVGIATTVSVFTSAIGGYIFAKFRFPGRNLLFVLFLATAMIPFQTYMVPFYLMIKNLGLINTYLGIMFPLFLTSFGIFFIRQNALSIPDDLLDAGRIDGASEWFNFSRIAFKLLQAPVAAIAIFNAMFGWKFFIWPLIVTNSPQKMVLELGLSSLAHKNAMDYGLQMAGAVFSILPILIVFLVLRQRFVSGITMTGMKS
jgi:multiple sugar transport system permease protein